MRKISLFLFLVFFAMSSFSQGINFETNQNLNEALAKAKSQNKLVFINAYVSWCGHCKMMAVRVFPLKEVGDYFNAHFINLRLDMEAPENLDIVKKYNVRDYPAYLFLNEAGEVVHSVLGSMPADEFIKAARIAGDSENNACPPQKKQ